MNMGISDVDSEDSDVEGFEQLSSELLDSGHMHEQALDASSTPNTGLVVTLDEYELSDMEEGEIDGSDVEMLEDSGWAWKAGVPDAAWCSRADEEGIEQDDILSRSDAMDNSDSSHSDSDSDELLSGDEDVLMRRT